MNEFAHDVRYPDHEWATDLRIPLVCTTVPAWAYEVALCVPAPDGSLDLDRATWPDDDEAAVIASLIEHRMDYLLYPMRLLTQIEQVTTSGQRTNSASPSGSAPHGGSMR